jgi:hypothetical protein
MWHAFWDSILGKLLYRYVTDGKYFAIAHVFVLGMIVLQTWYRKMLPETRALENWFPKVGKRPDDPSVLAYDPKANAYAATDLAEPTHLLDQFVEECEDLGEKGLFVPMTDFSDRLDSITDGMVAELHDRTNLFILVGVAGTLLGIFEFAFNSYQVLSDTGLESGQRLLKLGEFLSGSMAKAFPVSFIGLLLAFISQIVTSWPERRLRTALATATGKALEVRKAKSRSQAQLVQQTMDKLQEAMKPLENLKDSLTEVITPVISDLGARLEESLKLVKEQFDELQKTNTTTQAVVRAINIAVKTLQGIVNGLRQQIEQTRTVLDNVLQHQEAQKDSLRAFNDIANLNLEQVQLINHSIVDVVRNIDALPQKVQLTAQEAFDLVSRDMLSVWSGMSDEIKDLVVNDSASILGDIAEQARGVETSLLDTATRVSALTQGVNETLGSLNTMPQELLGEIKGAFNILAQGSQNTWESMSQEFKVGMQQEYLQYWQGIRNETVTVRGALQRAAENLENLSKSIDSVLKESLKATLHETKAELTDSLHVFKGLLLEQYPQVANDVISLSDSLKSSIAQAQTIQAGAATWLKDVQTAHESMSQIHLLLTDTLEQARKEPEAPPENRAETLLQQGVTELKHLNEAFEEKSKLILVRDQAVKQELEKSTQVLMHIKEGLNRNLLRPPVTQQRPTVLPPERPPERPREQRPPEQYRPESGPPEPRPAEPRMPEPNPLEQRQPEPRPVEQMPPVARPLGQIPPAERPHEEWRPLEPEPKPEKGGVISWFRKKLSR